MSLFFTSSSVVSLLLQFAGLTETVDEQVDFCSQVCVSSAQTDFGEVGSAQLNQAPRVALTTAWRNVPDSQLHTPV